MVNKALKSLALYGVEKKLIDEVDVIYVINSFLEILQLSNYEDVGTLDSIELEEILHILVQDAIERGVIEDSIVYKDLLDTRLMGVMVPLPSVVRQEFEKRYKESPSAATDWYYQLSCDSDYIRSYRIKKDKKWKIHTNYGELDITINLSKPEKDPKAIAAAKAAASTSYPKCMLCKENEGFSGTVTLPARHNHRIIPMEIAGSAWYLQYSPYVYYNEHCIAFNGQHVPMKIERATFSKMIDFVTLFPHYFIGSNADLPIVGGSILSHDHFQGGQYTFAMEVAKDYAHYCIKEYEDIQVSIVNWPMSVIRITHEDGNRLVEFADYILKKWQSYTDEEAFIFANTNGEPHNTITPIARRVQGTFQMDLVLRNNITTKEHPMGVYHPHEELHHIKKENIGLIEVMGLAVLPSRLKEEMEILEHAILVGRGLLLDKRIVKHAKWVSEFLPTYDHVTEDTLHGIIEKEIGLVFQKVLEHAGVFDLKQPYFQRFMETIGGKKL